MPLSDALEKEFIPIRRALLQPGFRFIIAEYNHFSIVTELEIWIRAKFAERFFAKILLREHTYESFHKTVTDIEKNKNDAILFIPDFHVLFLPEYKNFKIGFNQRRDRYASAGISFIVAMFTDESKKIANELPDWWSLRSMVLYIENQVNKEFLVQEGTVFIQDMPVLYDKEKENELEYLIYQLQKLEPEDIYLQYNLHTQIGNLYTELGKYTEAFTYQKKALEIAEKNLGTEHPYTATAYNNLASVLQYLGDYAGAKDLLEKAIKSNEKNFGTEHPITARSYNNLVTVLQALGDYAGAKDLLEKAIKNNEKNFGTEHPNTAITYNNLATVLQDLGDYIGAKDLFEKAIKSNEKNFGTEHPNTAIFYSNLARVLQALGDYAGAKDLLEKAMKSAEKNFGTEHPNTAKSYNNLASVLEAMKNYAEAIIFYEKALFVFRKTLPAGHPTTQRVEKNYADLLKKMEEEGEKDS